MNRKRCLAALFVCHTLLLASQAAPTSEQIVATSAREPRVMGVPVASARVRVRARAKSRSRVKDRAGAGSDAEASAIAKFQSSLFPKGQLVKFQPITREQYDSILRLSGGQPVISEARLVNSGMQSFGNTRSIGSAIESGVQYVLNVTGLNMLNEREATGKMEGYPLCVIKVNESGDVDDSREESGNSQGHGARGKDYSNTRGHQLRGRQRDNEDGYSGHGHDNDSDIAGADSGKAEVDEDSQGAVNCVVVVKRGGENNERISQKTQSASYDPSYASPHRSYAAYPPYGYHPAAPAAASAPPPPPYYYSNWYNPNAVTRSSSDIANARRSTKVAPAQTRKKASSDADEYYRHMMLALSNYYLQQSLQPHAPSTRQAALPSSLGLYPLGLGSAFPLSSSLSGLQGTYAPDPYATTLAAQLQAASLQRRLSYNQRRPQASSEEEREDEEVEAEMDAEAGAEAEDTENEYSGERYD